MKLLPIFFDFFSKNCILLLDLNAQKVYINTHVTGNSAAGSASGLGPGCRGFKSLLPDRRLLIKRSLFYLTSEFSSPSSEDVGLIRSRSFGAFLSMNLNKPLARFVFNGSSILGRFKSLLPDRRILSRFLQLLLKLEYI